MLQQVVDGEILLDQNEEFYLKGNNDEIISVHNLSTGMKSFIILKMLLEKGCLKNKDVVVLDEPEISLASAMADCICGIESCYYKSSSISL